jgi:hypothetical protein
MAMSDIKTLAIKAAYASGLPHMLEYSPQNSLTTILFHRFIYTGEKLQKARDRLQRQCEWVR